MDTPQRPTPTSLTVTLLIEAAFQSRLSWPWLCGKFACPNTCTWPEETTRPLLLIKCTAFSVRWLPSTLRTSTSFSARCSASCHSRWLSIKKWWSATVDSSARTASHLQKSKKQIADVNPQRQVSCVRCSGVTPKILMEGRPASAASALSSAPMWLPDSSIIITWVSKCPVN